MANLPQVLCCRRALHVRRLTHCAHLLQVDYKSQCPVNLFISWSLLKFRPLDDMEAWFQKFEAEERRQRMIMEAMQEQKSSQDSKPSGQDVKTEAEVAAAWDPAQRSKMASCSFPASTFILANSLNSLWSEKHRFIECAELCRLQSYVDKLTKIYFEMKMKNVLKDNFLKKLWILHLRIVFEAYWRSHRKWALGYWPRESLPLGRFCLSRGMASSIPRKITRYIDLEKAFKR